MVTGGIIPGGTRNNLDYIKDIVEWDASIPDTYKIILADAQTSGGLLIALPEEFAERLILDLRSNKVQDAVIIGKIRKGNPRVSVA
jgi:selenide,water dikinase